MRLLKNQSGSVLVFITLMIVLLLVMVGMGLDTGHLAFIRAQGQPAVDAAALSAASGLQIRDDAAVYARAGIFKANNTYLDSKNNPISDSSLKNVTYAQYDPSTGNITTTGVDVTNANAVRVALETTNPHTGTAANTSMASPLFLTPLFNVMGINVSNTANVSVSAVAALKGVPGLPIAIEESRCNQPGVTQQLLQSSSSDATKGKSFNDNSGYTTYHINTTTPPVIKAMLTSAENCAAGIPVVDVGYCTQTNNGVLASVYSNFGDLFAATPGKCFMLPVVGNGASWSGCETITKWAEFCPDPVLSVQGTGNPKFIQGTVTCDNVNPWNQTKLNCYVPTLVRDKKSGM